MVASCQVGMDFPIKVDTSELSSAEKDGLWAGVGKVEDGTGISFPAQPILLRIK